MNNQPTVTALRKLLPTTPDHLILARLTEMLIEEKAPAIMLDNMYESAKRAELSVLSRRVFAFSKTFQGSLRIALIMDVNGEADAATFTIKTNGQSLSVSGELHRFFKADDIKELSLRGALDPLDAAKYIVNGEPTIRAIMKIFRDAITLLDDYMPTEHIDNQAYFTREDSKIKGEVVFRMEGLSDIPL